MISKPYWHIHHKVLLEWSTEPITNRRKYIREQKPASEVPTRLRLLKPVKGKLPAAVVKAGAAYAKAGDAYETAGAAYDTARADYVTAGAAYAKAGAAYDKAGAAYAKAGAAYDKAVRDNMPAILKLHEKECDCGWTPEWPNIFPEEAGK